MKTTNKTEQTETNDNKAVKLSTPAALEVTGGRISGVFKGTQTRYTDDNEPYRGHVIEGSGIVLDRNSGKAVAAPEGRYFVFGKTYLDRYMREIQPGEKVSIEYLGKAPNTDRDGKRTEGEHHAYKVQYL